jgi:hypothetical protein
VPSSSIAIFRVGVECLRDWKSAAETAVRRELEGQQSRNHDGPELRRQDR